MNTRKLTLEQIQVQNTNALMVVEGIYQADKYLMLSNARIDTHRNELLCLFMDPVNHVFVERHYDNTAMMAKHEIISKSMVKDNCYKLLVDKMARGQMFIYRNVDNPFVIFNNGPDDILLVPLDVMIKRTLDIFGPEPMLQVTQRGFIGGNGISLPVERTTVDISPLTVSEKKTVKQPTNATLDERYTKINKVVAFKNKVRFVFKVKGGTEPKEYSADNLDDLLREAFGGVGNTTGGKLRRLKLHRDELIKSKLYVVYKDDMMIGGIVSFVDKSKNDVVNGYIPEGLIIKYIKRFMEADLDHNIQNVAVK